jgi:hypothetical protein
MAMICSLYRRLAPGLKCHHDTETNLSPEHCAHMRPMSHGCLCKLLRNCWCIGLQAQTQTLMFCA